MSSEIINATQKLLLAIGEDPTREGLRETPTKVAEAWEELTAGYRIDVHHLLCEGLCAAPSNDLVVVKDIEFYSICEHHLLPFFGKCHIAYLPDKKIAGLGTLVRAVETVSKKLQLQERLTTEIADAIFEALKPRGLSVTMEATHLCLAMRGAEKSSPRLVTEARRGEIVDRSRKPSAFCSR